MSVECPRTEMFQLLFTGQLAPEQQGPLADHAATCPDCHAVVEALVTRRGHGPPADARRPAPGQVIGGRFRIDQVIGAGGMGIVMSATHLELGHRVAIKFMREDKLESEGTVERFIREARAVVKLRTEHVCRVLDVARLDSGAPYIVMELLDGVDLARTIAARPLPAMIAVEYVMQATVALAEAHALGIVHRDLKPGNLFVTRRVDGGPLVKVLDFGIAKALDGDARLTRTRAMLGSPGYMSPEQIESARDVDARTDIWALGVTLYQLLSGRLPFPARNQTEIVVKIAVEPPEPIDIDPRLRAVVLRCLAKPRGDRYQDVVALAADLAPFGGPQARRLATMVAKVARQPAMMSTPQGVPAVSMNAPTAASVADSMATSGAASGATSGRTSGTGAVGTPSRAVPAVPLVPGTPPHAVAAVPLVQPRRARLVRFAVPAVALIVAAAAAIVVVIAVRGGRSPAIARPDGPGAQGSATAVAAPAPAAPGRAPAATPLAVTPGPAPAAPSVPAAAAPAPPAAKPAARETRGARQTKDKDGKDTPTTLLGAADQRKSECETIIQPSKASTVPPARLVECWCELHDQPRAQAVFAKIVEPQKRDELRKLCAPRGVELP